MKLVEIGKKISELRKEMNLTQGELASGICTQSLISLIERGESDPSAELLYQITKRLGVDVNYFFEIGSTTRLDYVNEVEKQLRRTRIFYQYNEMMEIVAAEEKTRCSTMIPASCSYCTGIKVSILQKRKRSTARRSIY